jgi:hypothetical protein
LRLFYDILVDRKCQIGYNVFTVNKTEQIMLVEKIEKNDVIRSYDFKPMYGRSDCFVEGRVVELTNEPGYSAVKIRVLVDEFDGKRFEERGHGCRVGEIVFVPLKVSFMDYPGRVINLTRI